ncbi:MAG: MgtC/SapB family protein [Bacillota bacterium]
MPTTPEIILRLSLACILGGLVGLERETLQRPAGFRTHILVSVASALVTLTNLFLLEHYRNISTLDPARLSAQIISGIGFLGAGTIIKEGSTVKGLTTAASLWTVAGIGIAVGSGFYLGSIVTTLFVLTALILFSRFEQFMISSSNGMHLKVQCMNRPGQIGKIGTELGNRNISITNIRMEDLDVEKVQIYFSIIVPRRLHKESIVECLLEIDGVMAVELLH